MEEINNNGGSFVAILFIGTGLFTALLYLALLAIELNQYNKNKHKNSPEEGTIKHG